MWFCVTLIAILVIFVLLLTVFHYTTDGRKYWKKRNVPYKEPCPIFGNFGPTLLAKLSYADTLKKFYNNNRNEKYVGLFQARRPTLMIIDLEIAKNVFSKHFSCFSDRITSNTDTKREPLLRNLANMSGNEWKEMRHIVSPTFSSAKMKAMFPLVAECAHNLKNTILQESNDEVDIPKLMTRYTTDVIGSCAFGVDPCTLKDADSPFLIMSQKMFKATRSAILKRYCRTFFPRLFKFLNLTTYSQDVAIFFSDIINQVLTERRAKGTERVDFLQLMLNEQHSETRFPMTDALITSNSFIFMLAGLETSATTLSFCLYQLAKDQELQEQLREEIKQCLKEHDEGLNYESVAEMKLCTMTVLETLRMHPPTPMTSRLCTAPFTLPGTNLEMKVKEGVLIPLQCMQKDPEYFPDPDKFDPSRFSENHSPQGFMAFGDGPRSCPGARFAQIAVVAALATTLCTVRVEPCARTTARIDYDPRSVMLKNKGGIWLKFTLL